MSKIVVFGAGGRAGRQVVAEAGRRGHEVTAVVRDPARYADLETVAGDVTDAGQVAALAKGHDAVISAAAVYGEGTDPDAFFVDSARALVGAGVDRLIVVGLSALLSDESGTLLMDAPGFPAEFRSFCMAHRAGLDVLREEGTDLDWLYVSPTGDFDHDGSRSGRYRIADRGDITDRISYADFAIALLDEVDNPKHHRRHLAVT
jgi:uncharacterized protein